MKWITFFISSAGAILLAASFERFLTATGQAQILPLPDPLLDIPLRHAVLVVGVIELLVALICLFGRNPFLQTGWLAWLMTSYAIYRIFLTATGGHQQGICIGSLTDPLHFARGTVGIMTAFVPLYLLLGSYAVALWFWLERRRTKGANFFKMYCPACGVHIRFDERNQGQKTPCPRCRVSVTLRKADLLKMACFFCKEHIEFPSHAIGEEMPCPHCKMDITLKEPE